VSAAAKLASETPETRARVVERLESGEARNVREALSGVRREQSRAQVASQAAPPPPTCQLAHSDVMDWISGLEDKSIDLLLTDPPYNVTSYDWDNFEGMGEYYDFMDAWLAQLHPKLAPGAVTFMFCDASFSPMLWQLLLDNNWAPRRQAIWHRPNLAKKRSGAHTFLSSYEPFWHCGGALRFPDEWGAERFDVQRFTAPQSNHTQDRAVHPTQKPLALFERLVQLGSDAGGVVADPFTGSGTSAVAALRHGRSFVGCDQSEEFVQIALGRIAQEVT
jgi:site-specific DNA-methyltransferase (adenine-specific)